MVTLNNPAAYLAEHYIYEVNMLRETHRQLASATDTCLRNALMESFCVHARALLDFYKSMPRGDDVVATHFVPSSQFTAAATAQLPNDLRTRVNKQIAHLTASRENSTKIDGQDRQTLLNAIDADHASFKAAAVSQSQYSNCFDGEIQYVAVPDGGPSATNIVQSS